MSNWNQNFTVLIRKSRPSLWGNWGLDPSIKPGLVGYIDTETGVFKSLAQTIPNGTTTSLPVSQKWEVKSKHVTEKKSKVELDGTVKDPETGIKITAGVEVEWGFKDEGSLSSSFAVTKEVGLQDYITLLKQEYSWLEHLAKDANHATSRGISQGFCVVTNVIYAKSGLNVGANSKESTFSIEGSVSGVQEMLGDSLSGKGSYVSTKKSSSMDSHLWPSGEDELAPDDIPIAFSVASYDGNFLIPNWTHTLSSFELILDNSHGGTYIAEGKLTYEVDGKSYESKNKASGGMSSTISDIPLEATNLKYKVTFKASSAEKKFEWDTPINQWPSGKRHIDVKGVWPGRPSAKDREA